jgi:hypothetical protein
MKTLVSIVIPVVCLSLTGCDDSKTPLSDPQTSKPDGRLDGVWRLRGEDGQVTYYHIGRADEKLPQGVMRAVGVTHRERRVEPPAEFLMFPTVLGNKTYLNMTEGKEQQTKLIEEKGWKAVDSYLIFKYQVDGDKLLVWVMDGDAKKRAIEGGKIKGVIEQNKPAKFTDTTENLARFVSEAGNELFPNEPVRLERIKP